jgi:hypothetical protein
MSWLSAACNSRTTGSNSFDSTKVLLQLVSSGVIETQVLQKSSSIGLFVLWAFSVVVALLICRQLPFSECAAAARQVTRLERAHQP